MTHYSSQLTAAIRSHLDALIRSSGLPETEESREEMARVWFEKKAMFEGQIKALDMRELESFPVDDHRGALLLTWSGSLLSMGPRQADTGGRVMEYASIELRTDVPHLAKSARGAVDADLPGESPPGFARGRSPRRLPCFRSWSVILPSLPRSRKRGYAKPPSF